MFDELAASQHGIVTRAQLRLLGLTDDKIDGLVAKRLLLRVHRGVYRVAGSPTTWMQEVHAACLASGSGGVASYRAAGALWQLESVQQLTEVMVLGERLPRIPGVLVHRTSSLPPADIGEVDGIPTTKVGRTLIDLAAVLPTPQLAIATDDALSRGLIVPSYLRRRLSAIGSQGRPGVAALLALLDERAEGRALAHRKLERLVFALLTGARDLPKFEAHFPVRLLSGKVAYLDYAVPRCLVAVEADSYRHHSSHTQWSRDHTRRDGLIELGWRIIPVTYNDAVNHPRRTLQSIRNTLAIAEACRFPRPMAG